MLLEILVCIEGSPSGARALEEAIRLARESAASLVGLAIVDEAEIRAGEATGIGGGAYKKQRDEALLEDAEHHVQEWLATFSRRCVDAKVASRTLEERGQPARKILEAMSAYDLTIMGRHANFKFETAATDRQTRDAVLHRARKPVLVVPEDAPIASPRAMVAFDGSSASTRAIRGFVDAGLARGRDVHVACVDDEGARAWEIANRGVALLQELGVTASIQNLVSPLSIADALLAERQRLGASLVVMGAYTRSRLSELIWGSVTHALVEKTPVPLFLHH